MAHVELENISLKFRKYVGQSSGLKEAVLRLASKPGWYKTLTPENREIWGLKNVSLSLRPGDRLGIIGHNGAGKSTLLKVICRIYKPTTGKVSVAGRVAPLIEIGAGFNPELSGRDNVFLSGAILGLARKDLKLCFDSLVEFAELGEFIDVPLKYYSTGMHLRLAYSLMTQLPPDILILDELYAGGDASFIQRANHRLEAFAQQSKILILVAHSMEYIEKFCNRVLILDHGEVLGLGDPAEMIPKYLAHASREAR